MAKQLQSMEMEQDSARKERDELLSKLRQTRFLPICANPSKKWKMAE